MEKNDLYNYGLCIYQNEQYFKFSLDSILLAEFVNPKTGDKILDLCTGNAPIPQILTTKNNNITIDAVELQEEIYLLAKKSIKENNLDTIINIINSDIKNLELEKKYDIITCNPPYFKVDKNSLLNDNKIKSIARHEVAITLPEIIDIVNKNIKENGSFCIVHKPNRLTETINLLEKNNFGIRKICFIFTGIDKNSEFFLLEATKNMKSDTKITYKNIDNIKDYKNIFKG